MQFKPDKLIFNKPSFLEDKTILFIDATTGSSRMCDEQFREEIRYKFKELGYTFTFLPEICERLKPELLDYMFPGQEDSPLPENMCRQIQNLMGLNGRSGFLLKENHVLFFHAIESTTDSDLIADFDGFYNFFVQEYCDFNKKSAYGDCDIRFSVKKDEVHAQSGQGAPNVSYCIDIEEMPNAKTREILAAWADIQRRFGISINDLAVLLGYHTKLSRLNITATNHIILVDWKNQPEVKLDDLTKALYFFYLNHPEGVVFKDLPDYEDEVLNIYMNITGRDDIQGIRKSVTSLCAPYSNGRDTCVSRIRKAFRDIVGDDIARKYYIDGPQGGVRKIALDRDLIIRDH